MSRRSSSEAPEGTALTESADVGGCSRLFPIIDHRLEFNIVMQGRKPRGSERTVPGNHQGRLLKRRDWTLGGSQVRAIDDIPFRALQDADDPAAATRYVPVDYGRYRVSPGQVQQGAANAAGRVGFHATKREAAGDGPRRGISKRVPPQTGGGCGYGVSHFHRRTVITRYDARWFA